MRKDASKSTRPAAKPKRNMKLVRQSAQARAKGFIDIGGFLFEFSQLEFTIRVVLMSRLKLSEEFFAAVTSQYDFAKLCKVTCKVSCIKAPSRKKEYVKVFNECLDLNSKRVLVAHGMWTDDFDGLSVTHVHRDKLESQRHEFKKDELRKLSDKAQQLLQRVIGFNPAPPQSDPVSTGLPAP
jgi:hypothetical protein